MPRWILALMLTAVPAALLLTCGCAKSGDQAPAADGSSPVTASNATSPASAAANAATEGAETQATPPASGQGGAQASGSASSGAGFTDWPCWRGPNADGIAPGSGINKSWAQKPPKVLWKVDLHDIGYSGPSVADGKVFILDHQGSQDVVMALDLRSGKPLWTYPYADDKPANQGYGRSTPTYSGGRLYTLGRLGLLNCLDARGGKLIWSHDLLKDFGGQRPQWDYAGSPLVDGDKLIICPGGKTGVAALDKNSGKTVWTGGVAGPPGYATAVKATLLGKPQYVIFSGKVLYGADASSGRTLWQIPWTTSYNVNAATPIVIDNFVFATSGYGVGCAMMKVVGATPEVTWKSSEIQGQFNTPVYVKGYLYGIGDPGNLVCLNPADGKAAWKQSGFEKGGVVCVDGILIAVAGSSGDVVMVKADASSYQELGRIKPLGGQTWAPPIVAQGKLFVRSTKALACLDLM